MSKVIYFDDNGDPQGIANFVYDEDALSSGGVIISEDTDDEQALDTWYLKDGKIKVRSEPPSSYHYWDNTLEIWVEDLTNLREDSLQKVDQLAESTRLRHITPGAGQAMTYEAKVREALAGDGPLLQAEANALGMSVAEVAQSVLAAHDAWQQAGARIEGARLRAKRDVREATTAQEMHEAVKALELALAEL